MSKIILIALLVVDILSTSASPVTFTIREKYDKIIDRYKKDNETAGAYFRIKDKDCLEELLRLKSPGTEITKKFWKFDVEAILEGAAATCNEDAVKESYKNMMMIIQPFGERYLDPYVNCYKNELYKLEPTATILVGFTPSQEFENSSCKARTSSLISGMANAVTALRRSSEYPQCLTPTDAFNIKVIKLKLVIIKGDGMTDEKVNEEAMKVAEYSRHGTKSVFECIMKEVGKSG